MNVCTFLIDLGEGMLLFLRGVGSVLQNLVQLLLLFVLRRDEDPIYGSSYIN